MSIKYTVINHTKGDIKPYTKCFRRIVNKTARILALKDEYMLGVIFCDAKEIREINRDYRSIDSETDVISFALMDEAEEFEREAEEKELGDIFINVERIVSQAEEYGHSELREASFLFTHGLLHLLGYDHTRSQEEEEQMFALQDEILKDIVERNTK